MKKKIRHPRNGDARPEYDFSSMRGGYAENITSSIEKEATSFCSIRI
jgi:hypothetical protein